MKNIREHKLTSLEKRQISNRFVVKASTLETPGNKPSIMLSIYDLVEKYNTIKFFSNQDEAGIFINALKKTD